MKLTCEFNVKDREFKKLDDFLDGLYDISQNIKDDVKRMAAEDAATIAENLAMNYQEYMQTYGGHPQGARIDDIETDSTRVKLKKNRAGEWTGAPEIVVNETPNGFTVKMSGKDVLYQEFGTGTVGDGDYEGNLPANWKYGSGPKILKQGRYKNGGGDNNIPTWYKKAIESGVIDSSAEVWYSPMGITEGNYAGSFLYKTWSEYLDQFQVSNNLKLGRNNMYIYVKKKLSKQ